MFKKLAFAALTLATVAGSSCARAADQAYNAQLGVRQGGATLQAAQSLAPTFTVRQGHRYRATVLLSGFEQFTGNTLIADKLIQVGFVDVVVTGSSGMRRAEGTWSGTDTTAQLDPHLTHVVELR